MKPAIKVNTHKGLLNGVESVVIDYTIDGVTWINHGVYINKAILKIERIKETLLAVGATSDRSDHVFGY